MKSRKFSEDQVAEFWNKNAALWTEYVRKGCDGHREHFNNPAFFDFIGDLRGKIVLDAGCGEGFNTRLLAKNGVSMVGIDISERLIEAARQYQNQEPLGIRYEVASFSDLSLFNDSSFDSVVSFMALMDGPNFKQAIKEIFRVLRPSGALMFSMLHPCFITKGNEWLRDEEGNCTKLTVSDYFSNCPWIDQWHFKGPTPADSKPFTSATFPVTLSDILNTLIGSRFVVSKIDEPRPTELMCKEHSWLRRWRNHASLFLYIRVTKPK